MFPAKRGDATRLDATRFLVRSIPFEFPLRESISLPFPDREASLVPMGMVFSPPR